MQQTPDHGRKRVHGRQFGILLISGQQRAKAIGGGEHHFGKVRAMEAGNLGRKHVFEFVREFAEFVESASRGIAF